MFDIIFLPKNILVSVLRKVDDQSWFRLRQTGKFLLQFVEDFQNSFPLRYANRKLEIVYMQNDMDGGPDPLMEYCMKKLIRVFISSPNEPHNVEVETPELSLKGRGFQLIISDEDRPKILSAFRAFSERLPLHCERFSSGDKVEYLHQYSEFVSTMKNVAIHVYPGDEEKLLKMIENPTLNRIKGLSVSGKRFTAVIIPLINRFERLVISDISEDFIETRDTLQRLFQEIRLGEINGNEPKWLKYSYYWNGGEDIEESEELKGLEKIIIWKGKKRFADDEEEDEVNFLVYLLECSSSTATVVFTLADHFGLLETTFYIDIRRTDKAEDERQLILERIDQDVKKDREEYWKSVKEQEEETKIVKEANK